MGHSESKRTRLSTEKRQEREQLKHLAVQQRKQEIDNVQESVLKQTTCEEQPLVTREVITLMHVGETVKNQLDRGGKVLTKLDLMAVVIALDPTIGPIDNLTVSDLNSTIRSIVYDPQRILAGRKVFRGAPRLA